jgi:glutamine amidotransferase
MGNLHSVAKVLHSFGVTIEITQDPQRLQAADGVILPGVGAFDPAMHHLQKRHLIEPLQAIATSGKPFFGICLGMQLLFQSSEEGQEPGLGILPGQVRRFRSEPGLTIPHMGWNTLHLTQPHCPLWQHLNPELLWTYFVHSFYVQPQDVQVCAAEVTHGQQTVTAAIATGNVFATQFHPEKSSQVGLQILKNFVEVVQRHAKADLDQ